MTESLGQFWTELSQNSTIWCCLISWFSAQLAKYFIDGFRHDGWNVKHLLFGSGGMPSSHTAFVTTLCVRVGMEMGFDSPVFAVCFVILFVVMTDAIGVRRETGKQGTAINMMMDWFEQIMQPAKENDTQMKERMGHSAPEVLVGFLWGIGVALLFFR